MARRRLKEWDELELAIEGEGVNPREVAVRDLVRILEAATTALEQLASERALEIASFRLVAVKKGSAAYVLSSPSPQAVTVFSDFYAAAKERGRGRPPAVRRALDRLHHEAAKIGALRVRPSFVGKRSPRAILLAAPVDEPLESLDVDEHVYGVVTGVFVNRAGGRVVRLREHDGAAEEYAADIATAHAAANLLGQQVRAVALRCVDETGSSPLELSSVEAWHESGFLEAVQDFRESLDREGIEIDADALIAELKA
jgi:hypothetical protein